MFENNLFQVEKNAVSSGFYGSQRHRVLFFGYYNRFYLFTLEQAEIGEFTIFAFLRCWERQKYPFPGPRVSLGGSRSL
jgi:hypothetical protein